MQVKGKNGEFSLPCDTLIQATGFEKHHAQIFDKDVMKQLQVEEDGLYLYRQMVPVNLKNIYFLGNEVASISNIMTHGIQAKWVESFMENKIVTSKERMSTEVEKVKKWKRSWMPLSSGKLLFLLF